MSDARNNRWKWEVSGFEPRKASSSFDAADRQRPNAPLVRRSSISASSLSQRALSSKVQWLKDNVKLARQDYLELRQEAGELQEYSNAKLDRVTRYVGAVADKTLELERAALEGEARIATLVREKKLSNDLLASGGNIKVFCRSRPLFEDEGPSAVEFPDDLTIRVNTGDETRTNPKKDYEFDRVYGPHVGQAEIFSDVQPLVQSALDGFKVSIFAYGPSNSGKMQTMEGSSHDRGLYVRCFEELFYLANLDATAASRYDFSVTVFELHNEQVRDLVRESGRNSSKIYMGSSGFFVELAQEKVDDPLDFLKVLKEAFQSRGNDVLKFNVSHLIVTIHISYNNLITRENLYSKLSLVDLAGSEGLNVEDGSGERVTELLHVLKSLSALGDVLSSLASKKHIVPYQNSTLTRLLADSLGGSSKTLLIVNVSPDASNVSETLSSLNFASRARNAMLSLGNRDTIKKWREVANDARKVLYEKDGELQDVKQEVLRLKQALEDASDQHVLFDEGQKAWKVSYTLQSDLKSENIMLADMHKIQMEQNAQLRNELAQLVQLQQDWKLQMQRQNSTIQSLQAKIRSLEHLLNDALLSSATKSKSSVDSGLEVQSLPKAVNDRMDSSIVTKKLEEELKKLNALIEISSSLSKGTANMPSRTNNNIVGHTLNVVPLPSTAEKSAGSVPLVRTSYEKVKTTPEGEYLTAALNDFDPEQYDSTVTVSEEGDRLLMLVLVAVSSADAPRDHEILAEIRDAVFSFIRKMERRSFLDPLLVSHVRMLYVRSLIARSPELQYIKVLPVDCFLEKANSGRSRRSSRGDRTGRSQYVEEQIRGFKVNIKPVKKSKFSSVVLKLGGIDQETWWQHVPGGKLREITEEAKSFSTGNKSLAALFVHTPVGALQQQIKSWLVENFEFLSVTVDDAMRGTTNQSEDFSTAIMDGWMAGLGVAMPPKTDALGQLLSDYTMRV